jgi:hypothetical protein
MNEKLKKRMQFVREYFANITDEQLEKDLKKAGMGYYLSWAEIDANLYLTDQRIIDDSYEW